MIKNYFKPTNGYLLAFFLFISLFSFGQTTQTFTSSGTFTVPCDVTSITVQAWGGGGGGHNSYNRGGGGGAFAQSTINVSQGNSYVITVGQGATSGSGDNGGDSSFGTIVIAKGGNGGNGGSNSGRGGQASQSTGDIRFSGGNGGSSSGNGGAGGGGAAGTTNNGANGNNTNNGTGASGGTGTNGGGSGGNGGGNSASGIDGVAPGGGGGERGENGSGSGGGGNGRVVITYTSSLSSYCTPSYNSNVEPITNVTFAGINNTTTNALGGSSLETFCITGSVVQGSTTNAISVKGNTDGNYRDYFKVYIDWDQNGVFGNNANEIYDLGSIKNSTGLDSETATANIAVPSTAVLGNTRMRVVKTYNNYGSNSNNPCYSGNDYGQAEDYNITVTSPCSTYSLTSVAAVATACTTTKTTTVTLSSTAAGLPVGTYTVTYSLSYNSNSTSYTAPMTVTTAGTGQFTASLSIMGANNSTTIRINNLASGSCNNAISSNNVSNTVNQYQPITPTAYSGYASCSTWYAQWQNDTFVSGYFLDVATTSNFAPGTYVSGFQDLNVGNVIVYPITGLTPGATYYYRIRNNNLGCGVSVNSNVISFVAGGAVAPTIGPITHPTCSTSTGSFTITNYVSWHNYTISPSTGVSRSGAVVTAPPGTYTISDSNSGCSSAATSFTINAQPISSVAPTGITGTNSICSGASTTLTLTGGTAGSGTATWYSGSCGGVLVGTGNSITVSPTSTTTYYVRYQGGCNTTACASRTVTVSAFPTAANAGPDQALANATSFTLAANTPTVGTGVWTIVSGPSTSLSQFSNTASPTAIFTPSITGTYVLNWAISNSCGSSSDQVVIANNCVTNLITNGDFSAGTSGWTNATTQGTYVESYSEDVYFGNGNSSLTAELDSEASLRQVLTVIPGVSYTVSFRYARRPTTGTPATTGVTVKVTGGTSDIVSTGFTTTTTTVQIASFTFTPTSATVGLEFYNTLHGGITLGTIIDDIVLLPASQAAPVAVTNPKGVFNTSTSCAGVPVSLDVENVPASGVSYSWTGSAGAVFSATNIKNPTITFTGSGIQQATVTVTTAAGCSVTSTTYVNIAAAPVVTAPLSTSVCSGSTYSSGPITSTGTTFDWSRAAVPNINGGLAATGGTNIAKGVGFTEVLTNSSTSPIDVTYILIPRSPSSSCPGIPYNLVITVKPSSSTPTLGVPVQPTCSAPYGTIVLSNLPSTGTITQNGTVNTNYPISGGGTQTITNLAGGTYNFTVTISGGCASSATANVVINNPPGTNTWTGSWSNGTPTIEQRVIFNANYSSSTDVEACSCQVNNADVVFNTGHTLKVVNDVEVKTNGSLTFMNNASLVQINDAAINSGKINYHRYTAPVKRYDFTYWSSPVEGQTMKALSPNTLYDKYYSYNPNTGWVIRYNGVIPTTLYMEKGNGYIIRAPQTFSITVASVDTNPTFIGKPNNGVVSFPIAGNKVHLLGNPYPSALDADAFLDANSAALEGTLYFWTHNSPPSNAVAGDAIYNYTTNDYATYNRTGGVGTAPAKVDSDVNDPNNNNNLSVPTGKIAAGQGFFAPASTAGGTVMFNNSMRVVGGASGTNNSQFFKLSSTAKESTAAVTTREKNRVWLNLTNSQGAFKQTLVGYITGATNDYDNGFDGVTYDGNTFVDFYSINNAVNLAIQARALPFVKKDSVALGYKSTIVGDFQISIDHTDGALATQNIFLEDKDLQVLHDLKKEPYTFSTQKGAFNNRFVLRYVDKNAPEEVVEPETPEVLSKEVLVSVKDGAITINSSLELLDKIIIYDSAGRKIYLKDNIEANTFVISQLFSSHQVLIVEILLSDGTKLSRKIVY